MLPALNRLTKKRDFDLLFKFGSWSRGQGLALKYLELAKNRDYLPKKTSVEGFDKQLRIAVSVGLKFSKKAVERNRAKRQLIEMIRELLKKEQLRDGYYLMIMPEKKFNDHNFAELSQELKLLLNKSGVGR